MFWEAGVETAVVGMVEAAAVLWCFFLGKISSLVLIGSETELTVKTQRLISP